MNTQRLQFTQQEQAENVVHIGVGEHNPGDRRLADAFLWVKFGSGFNLRAKVGEAPRRNQAPSPALMAT